MNIGSVDRSNEKPLPAEFRRAAALADLQEGKPTRAEVNGTPILLVKSGANIFALAETYSHLGGPSAEGRVEGETIAALPNAKPSRTQPRAGKRSLMPKGSPRMRPSRSSKACVPNGKNEREKASGARRQHPSPRRLRRSGPSRFSKPTKTPPGSSPLTFVLRMPRSILKSSPRPETWMSTPAAAFSLA